MRKTDTGRMETGVRNLDPLLMGGLPRGSMVVMAGPPGAGKTILAQQICFHNASPRSRVVYFNTLSEPTAKTLRYLSRFSFFDARKLDDGLQFVDLGVIQGNDGGLEDVSRLIMEQIKKAKPATVVIDSFKVFDDLAKSTEELRKFGYEIAVRMMAWQATTFLLGEYGDEDISTNPLFSIVDGLITVKHREQAGEQQRFIQITKMRGTEHSRDEHPFVITGRGIEIFAPRVVIQREDRGPGAGRCKTGIAKLDELLGEGIPWGSSLLVGGVAGTGKTILLLEFVYLGALAGEKGIVFSFEETEERLRASARGLGWRLDEQIERGMVEIVFIPQPNIVVEGHLLMMAERIQALGAKRVAIDSLSVFLHKSNDRQMNREKVFQLASIVQNNQAVGFFATDIPYGSNQISRFGVEETVVDGVILLSSTEEGFERQRYIEVYKLRNTAHLKGRHNMVIGPGGITIYPRYSVGAETEVPPPIEVGRRLASGVPGLDPLLGGGLLGRSVTLVSGSAGIGKSTLGLQFIVEGVKRKERGLYVALEEGPGQILKDAESLDLSLGAAVDEGLVEIVHLSHEHIRANQFLAILTDKIRANEPRRLVLDSVGRIMAEGMASDELRQLLHGLVSRFKMLGVTSLLTLEVPSMYSTETITDRGFSSVVDNLVLLRYVKVPGEIRPSLSVIKTRGSAHDRGTYYFDITRGGVRVGARVDGVAVAASAKKRSRARSRRSKR